MATFIGIDGGGTRVTAVAADEHDVERARVEEEGGALVRPSAPEREGGRLVALVRRTLDRAGAAPPADALCCALAGAGRADEVAALRRSLQAAGLARSVEVVPDFEAGFVDAFGRAGAGILLVAGTGSVACARAADGRTARAGGWGARIGDEGGAYAVGIAALRAAARAHDGRGPATALLDRITSLADVDRPESLIAWVDAASKAEIAALAPVVIALANESDDDVARSIVDRAVHDLALHAAALRDRLAPWPAPPPVAVAGGLLDPGRPLRDSIALDLASLHPPLSTRRDRVDAARGAARLARDRAM